MFRFVRYCAAVLSCFLIASVLHVVVLRFVPVSVTPLMVLRKAEAYREGRPLAIRREWRDIGRISPDLRKAVVTAEDARFYEHGGFSEEGLRRAYREYREGCVRHGGSTISQQTAKNVFCLPQRTFLRKIIEAYYTLLIELLWGKERILEVYLNVAEMGDGIFGAEAAAEYWFATSAACLTREQAACLAAALPAPRTRMAATR